MFQCDICGKSVPPGTKCERVVLKYRRKEYTYRKKFNKQGKELRTRRYDDKGGVGKEAVKEARCCPKCAEKLKNG